MSDDKRQRMLEKIQALLKKTRDNGASEAECETAMGMVSKLMDKYNIEEAELRSTQVEDNVYVTESTAKSGCQLEHYEKTVAQICTLIFPVKCYLGSEWSQERKKYNRTVVFYGEPDDCVFACMLFSELCITMRAMARARGIRKQFDVKKYCMGFSEGLYWKVKAEQVKHEEEVQQSGSEAERAGTGLILYKKDKLVRYETENLKLTKGKRSKIKASTYMSDEYSQGKADGKEYEINRPNRGPKVTGGGGKRLQ